MCLQYWIVEDGLDEEQKAIQQTAYQFAQSEMAPFMYEWDRTVRNYLYSY